MGEAGTCVPVIGPPQNGRTACDAAKGGDVCSAATCDGIDRTACKGFTGEDTMCRAASCSGAVATLAAFCTGRGACAELATSSCAPYVCRGTQCVTACAADADCAMGFRCDTTTGTCKPDAAASCDGMHTLIAPDGMHQTDCSPYACAGASCKTACISVLDCVYPASCTPDGKCVGGASPTGGAPTAPTSGCACRGAGAAAAKGEAGGAFVFAIGLAGALARRRRYRDRSFQ
jgi:MYXO-CTERM domain-containing protein